MDLTAPQIRILSASTEVQPYVDEVRAAGDEESDALGFLPQGAYADAAEQGRLLVAGILKAGHMEYAGHLLFGFVFPYARIFQAYVRPEFRLLGIGRKLVEALINRAEKSHFLSIKASVANDLAANSFWERLGFRLVRTRTGGAKTERSINIRIRELSTPSLLDIMRGPSATQIADLTFIDHLSGPSPIYAMDLNVFFDVTKKRPRAAEAGRVIRASFNNLVRLAVTEEFIHELERTSKPSPTDPVLEFAANLPILSPPPSTQLPTTISTLAPLVFPERYRSHKLSEQDKSDLTHLAIAIHNKVAGFITGEKSILRSRERLRADFGLDVISVTEFAGMVETSYPGEASGLEVISCGATINTREVEQPADPDVQTLFKTIQPPAQLAAEALQLEPGISKRRILVFCDGRPVALGCWEAPSNVRPKTLAVLFADEDHGAVEPAVDFLLDSMCRESLHGTPILIRLRIPSGHVATARIALGYGFTPTIDESNRPSGFQKLCVGRPINRSVWATFTTQVRKVSGLGFPEHIPDYLSSDQMIGITNSSGVAMSFTLTKLETLFSPMLLLLPGRPGAIVPIRRKYVGDLLGGSPQMSFLRLPEARLFHERVYFSSPRNERLLTEGTPMLFYESGQEGGRASIIAAARVLRSERVSKNVVLPRHARRGVLDPKNLQRLARTPTLAATTFDNLFLFSQPVSLKRLRQIGCRNFITARQIPHEKLAVIIQEGFPL